MTRRRGKPRRRNPPHQRHQKLPAKMSKLRLLTISVMLLLAGTAVEISEHFYAMEQWTRSIRMESETVDIPAIFRWKTPKIVNGINIDELVLDDGLTDQEIDAILQSFHDPFYDEMGNLCAAADCPFDST